ncbi:MAG: hypothetical protein PHS41_06990 [Victivallaceae bacterium]|nr:hypothetical protein [Victivallaceae bacterium]
MERNYAEKSDVKKLSYQKELPMDKKAENELLVEIGKLYFKKNKLTIKHRSQLVLSCFISDTLIGIFNPFALLINIFICILLFLFYSIIQPYFIIIIVAIFFILYLETGFFVPVYCRRSPLQLIRMYYQTTATRLISIITPLLYRFLCNEDGSVKEFSNSVAATFIGTKIGTMLATSFYVDETLLQLIMTYLASKGLTKYCSTTLVEPPPDIIENQMNCLKQLMTDFVNKGK